MKTNDIVLELDHGPDNPRNSEGAFIALADGRIMYAYTRYRGKSGADHGRADIAARCSADGGRTWGDDRLLVAGEGLQNVMSVSLLRLSDSRIALFYLRKNSVLDCRLRMRLSDDEGETWGEPILCVPTPGYHVTNNDRVIQLRSGRLVVPSGQHRAIGETGRRTRLDRRSIMVFYLSDDLGQTWHESKSWWGFPGNAENCLQEPGVVERLDGSLYAWCRTSAGCQYELASNDGGDTWSEPRPSRFKAPCSPMSIKRIPGTSSLLAVWNDHSQRQDGEDKTSWGRTPLAVAISPDDGATWGPGRLIETDPQRGFCYISIHFTDDAVLLAYQCGGATKNSGVLQDACIRRITYDWLGL